jgi:hypothetical protein
VLQMPHNVEKLRKRLAAGGATSTPQHGATSTPQRGATSTPQRGGTPTPHEPSAR